MSETLSSSYNCLTARDLWEILNLPLFFALAVGQWHSPRHSRAGGNPYPCRMKWGLTSRCIRRFFHSSIPQASGELPFAMTDRDLDSRSPSSRGQASRE